MAYGEWRMVNGVWCSSGKVHGARCPPLSAHGGFSALPLTPPPPPTNHQPLRDPPHTTTPHHPPLHPPALPTHRHVRHIRHTLPGTHSPPPPTTTHTLTHSRRLWREPISPFRSNWRTSAWSLQESSARCHTPGTHRNLVRSKTRRICKWDSPTEPVPWYLT